MKRKTWMYFAALIGVSTLLAAEPPKAAPAEKVKPLVLRLSTMGPSTTTPGTQAFFHQKACDEVAKLTEGRVKIDIYWSETLVKVKESPRAIQRGVCDIGWVSGMYHGSEFPLWTHCDRALYFPQGSDGSWLARKAWELFDNCKPLQADMEKLGQTVWFFNIYDSFGLFSKKIIKTLEDMKGMRLRVSGEGQAKMMSAIGAHPIFITGIDTYPALETGLVDGATANWEWGKRYRLYEVVPYIIDLDAFASYGSMNVSLAALRRMSEKDRKVFMDAGRRASIEFGEAMKRDRGEYIRLMEEKGVKAFPFSTEQRAKWAELPAVKVIIKNWIDEQNKAGRPGTEVMRTFLKTFEVPQLMPAGY